MLVVLEGLEGVGKSSLGVSVAELLAVPYVKSPPPEMNSVRGFIASRGDSHAGFYFYVAGLFALQKQLREALGANSIVIVDRYVLSTIAYWDGGSSFAPPAFDLERLRPADLTIRVTCKEATRLSRAEARGFHIYDRPTVDEAAIDTFFADRCDETFVNDRPLEESVAALAALIMSRSEQA